MSEIFSVSLESRLFHLNNETVARIRYKARHTKLTPYTSGFPTMDDLGSEGQNFCESRVNGHFQAWWDFWLLTSSEPPILFIIKSILCCTSENLNQNDELSLLNVNDWLKSS